MYTYMSSVIFVLITNNDSAGRAEKETEQKQKQKQKEREQLSR